MVEADHGRNVHALKATGQVAQIRAFAAVGAAVLAVGRSGFSGPKIIGHGVDSEKTEHQGVDGGDEGIAQDRIDLVEDAIDQAAGRGPENGSQQKDGGQGNRNIAQLAVNDAAHDGLGENVEQIGPHGQNPLDAGTHQGRGDDEPAAGADAAGDQAGAEPDENGNDKDAGAVKSRAIGLFPPQQLGKGVAHGVGKGDAAQQDRKHQKPENQQTFPTRQDLTCVFDFPLCHGRGPAVMNCPHCLKNFMVIQSSCFGWHRLRRLRRERVLRGPTKPGHGRFFPSEAPVAGRRPEAYKPARRCPWAS